ncbi:shikimate kinase [Anaerosacchariphilus polymeriproducens]|uniref:Shikimate kinase n=1 Tax=Anaerosacchariphilus polymeriproducens TaxID=1812858 RepID=A0A371B0A1_9FIRM|nr:shikimate kinase [Anaerosacchariphilus polymeriproducens]RDU25231.1 shikimate kinase [Anaerosacchariphilus polymeriproducens]
MKNIILIGFMGTGKTTVSNTLSKLLDLNQIDTDNLIKVKEKLNITQIFQKKGEQYFRDCETKILKELDKSKNFILSCGGGMALKEENRRLMKELGVVVWLSAAPQTILSRVETNMERPILNGNMNLSYIENLIKKREKYYENAADIMITTDGKTVDQICDEIIIKLQNSKI